MVDREYEEGKRNVSEKRFKWEIPVHYGGYTKFEANLAIICLFTVRIYDLGKTWGLEIAVDKVDLPGL